MRMFTHVLGLLSTSNVQLCYADQDPKKLIPFPLVLIALHGKVDSVHAPGC